MAVIHIHAGQLGVQQHIHLGFQQLFKQDNLELLVIIQSNGIVQRAPAMAVGRIARSQRIHQLLGDASRHLAAVLIQIPQQGQADHQIAAHAAVLFHQQHLRAAARRRQRRRDTARAAANNTYIILPHLLVHKTVQPPKRKVYTFHYSMHPAKKKVLIACRAKNML